jgi:peroxiredoxin/YHS domain-containing protein
MEPAMPSVRRVAFLALALLLTLSPAATAQAPTDQRAPARHNLSNTRLAIQGYDPVAYFPEGGGAPAKGREALTVDHNGVIYRFTSQAHADLFKQNPAKYEPAHGGWCTYAMGADGSRVEVDPRSFLIADGRLFLFYKDLFNNTRASFLKDQAALTAKADANWLSYSGEHPRTGSSLQSQLDALKKKFNESAPADRVKVYEDGIRQVAASGALENALKVGAKAPDFSLADASGKSTRLADLLKDGPVVLTWYRGGWCPYCNLQLRAYQHALPKFTAAGARLVALSPELPDNSLTTKEKEGLQFAVLSDKGNAVARQYGVAYRLPDELIAAFKGRLDLPRLNGDDSWELPLAATYLIGQDGTIAYAFIDADYRKRAEPAALLEALEKLRRR